MTDGLELTKTNHETSSEVENRQPDLVDMRVEKWIDFNAVGGLITDADGNFTTMRVHEFADKLGVSKQTLYNWRDRTPDFWERVKQRRLQFGSQARLQKVYNGLYLKAASGNPEAIKLYLQINDGWKPPKQELEVEHNFGLADLVSKKKTLIDQEKKVIDVTPNGTTETDNS